jgi:hypothetical protein
MTSTIQFKRKIGATSSPVALGAKEGELALAFPGAAGAATKPTIWAFDGVAWRDANPSVSVSTQSISLPAGTDIGVAYTAWATTPANVISGNVVIATFGTPPGAYILTNPSAPGTAGSWTSLGGATTFALQATVNAGTDTIGAINSATLRGTSRNAPTGGAGPVAGDANMLVRLGSLGEIDPAFIPRLVSTDAAVIQTGTAINAFLTAAGLRAATVQTSAGTADHDKLPRLDANGKLDPSMLPANATRLAGTIDPTVAPPTGAATPKAGDMYFTNKAGAVNAGFTGAAGQNAGLGDSMIFDGTKWYLLADDTDLTAYVPLAGTALMTGAIVYAGAANSKAGTVIYDGKGGKIDAVAIDCGTW